ncbi:MAG: aminomethyltransferase family protein [Chromatiales bacterium]
MRQSQLSIRHRELGSKLDGDTWNDMPMAWTYHTDPQDEILAVRTRAGLYDFTGLNLVDVKGPDAETTIDKLVAIDVTKLKPGTARLAAEVDEHGGICDDIMVIRYGKDDFRLSHGSGATQRNLKTLAAGKNVSWEQNHDAHVLCFTGPRAAKILAPHVAFDLSKMKYFQHIDTQLFGKDVKMSRSGYSGEDGVEIYSSSKDIIYLWDTILAVGARDDVMPCSWTCLDIGRVEAYLLFYPFDMPEGDTTPWEVNMGWAVDLDKPGDYTGKKALLGARGKERYKQAGICCKADRAMEEGAKIYKDGKEVGLVTTPIFSRYLMQSLAMVHLKPDCTALGTVLEVRGKDGNYTGIVSRTPFYDPQRIRTRA